MLKTIKNMLYRRTPPHLLQSSRISDASPIELQIVIYILFSCHIVFIDFYFAIRQLVNFAGMSKQRKIQNISDE